MKKIERILQYIESQSIDLAEFERKNNISNGYFANTRKRGADITEKILDRIKEKSKEIYARIFTEEMFSLYSEKEQTNSVVSEEIKTPYISLLEERYVREKEHSDAMKEAMQTVLTFAKDILASSKRIETNLDQASKDRFDLAQKQIDNQTALLAGQRVLVQAVSVLVQPVTNKSGSKSSLPGAMNIKTGKPDGVDKGSK